MKHALLAFVAACGLVAPSPSQAQSTFSADQIRAILAAKVDQDRRAVGMVVGVIDEGGRAYFTAGRSCREGGPPLDQHAVFEVGSLTKPFTVALMNVMAAAGEINPDQPITEGLKALGVDSAPGFSRITYQHLADHTSGLPVMPPNLTTQDAYGRPELVQFIRSYGSGAASGGQRSYSNLGMGLLGVTLAAQTGGTYPEVLQARVIEPLKLESTGFGAPTDRRVCGHDEPLTPMPATILGEGLQPSGGLLSTADDMLDFLSASMGLNGSIHPKWGRPQDVRGLQLFLHDGSTPGFASYMAYDPERRRGVVVLSNARFLVNDVALHLLQPDYPLVPRRLMVELAPEAASARQGDYGGSSAKTTVASYGGRLFLIRAGQPVRELFAEGGDRFFLEDSRPVHITPDALVLFQRDGLPQRLEKQGPPSMTFTSLSIEAFDQWAGTYRLSPDSTVELLRRGPRYFARITGQDALEILPAGENRFRYLFVDAEIKIDARGRRLVILQGGEETEAVRIGSASR